MEKLKKKIIDNLYKVNFYEVFINLKELENHIGKCEELYILYYFTYDLMEWLSNHKKEKNIKKIESNKKSYFNRINKLNNSDKSNTYIKLYEFLENNFTTFEHFTWFGKKEKALYLLNQAEKVNSNNLEAKFYKLFIEDKIENCFLFLNENILDVRIIKNFLNKIWYNEYLDESKQLREKYSLEKNDFIYYAQKEDYIWLYKYYNKNEEEKYKNKYISFGKVCFKIEKYDEAINFYNKKESKNNHDYYTLAECFEKIGQKDKAIENYKNYYLNFQSGFWKIGIEKLLKLKAYDEIKIILENEKSWLHKNEKEFFEAKILNIENNYKSSIDKLNGFFDSSQNYDKDLKENIYLLYILNYYKYVLEQLKADFTRVIKEKDFQLNWFKLSYSNYSIYNEFEKFSKKLNIEYNNKHSKKIKNYKNQIHNKYIILHQKLYEEIKKVDFKLTEDLELYYLSSYNDNLSIDKRISIYHRKIKYEPENPKYYLELGKLYYKKANQSDKDFLQAVKNLKKSINLSQKYFVNLNGEAEFLLIKINEMKKEENKQLFDDSIKNYIFHNSYSKDIHTTFFEQILYKYQNFSMNTLSSLTNNYLYFANPSKLNDPFDVASETLEKQFKNLELNKNEFKLCSLSKIGNNKLMWSHYSNEHSGICIGYKFLYLPNYVAKAEIQYRNTNLDEKEIFQNILDYWIVKSEDWEYEREVRLLHYGNKEKINYTFDIKQSFEENIIGLKIISITLGLNFKEDNYNIIKQIVKDIEDKQKTKISIIKARIEKQKLILEEIDIL
ncbi:DUF2971 domain-containing protein [Aliarcobacter butzleri]|uniref:DUF2971 domain-containing protein n=1 Tax=Aliarcobacter butzleri TaxID=28197 RepID=UPI0021B15B1E|nr:DUF2971 domain-containing protein [Aliarcobacter butzleri]MCT7553560.1 DUF2971 domain-containing protein [Aliarcobacter butzleri]